MKLAKVIIICLHTIQCNLRILCVENEEMLSDAPAMSKENICEQVDDNHEGMFEYHVIRFIIYVILTRYHSN